ANPGADPAGPLGGRDPQGKGRQGRTASGADGGNQGARRSHSRAEAARGSEGDLMAAILVVGEQAHGHLKKATLSALTAAQQMAKQSGGQVQGVLVGSGIGTSAQELASYGITVHAVDAAPFEHAVAETHAAA